MPEPEPTKSEQEIHLARIDATLKSGVPKLYFNGFSIALTSGDITTSLELNGVPVALLSMSYTVAKTLSVKLGNVIATFEAASGREMLTTDEVNVALERAAVGKHK
jgi:hypothetical protein